MSDAALPTRAVIYVRISDDREGAGAGVARQEADCRRLAETLGWGVGDPVIENDTSAFKRKRVRRPNGSVELRVVRPGFRRVVDMLLSGAADGLIAYDLDRTARDPRDLEDLVDAVEQGVPRIPVRSVSGSLRLDNDADVTMARVMVAVANKSSRDTQRRVARKHEDIAKAGRYGGGGRRRYGYELDGTTVRTSEAKVITEAARRILAGESARSICADLDQRGIACVKAGTWSTTTLIGILRSARIAGLREHKGSIVGPAAWPAIIDVATRDALLAQLAANSRGRGKPALKYWCNRLLWCSKCGETLVGTWLAADRHRYWCASTGPYHGCGGIGIAGRQVEEEIERQVLEILDRPDVVTALAAGTAAVQTEETRRLLDLDEQSLRELAQAYGQRQITLTEWLEAREPIEQRISLYKRALSSVVSGRVRAVLAAPDRQAAWTGLQADAKREVAQVLLASGGFRGWLVAPADPSKPRRFDPSRLSLAVDRDDQPQPA